MDLTALLEGLAVAAVFLALSALTSRYIQRPFLLRNARLRRVAKHRRPPALMPRGAPAT